MRNSSLEKTASFDFLLIEEGLRNTRSLMASGLSIVAQRNKQLLLGVLSLTRQLESRGRERTVIFPRGKLDGGHKFGPNRLYRSKRIRH